MSVLLVCTTVQNMLLVWILKGVTTVSVSVGMQEMEQNALVRKVINTKPATIEQHLQM